MGFTFAPFYDVIFPVGEGQANHSDDVMLVQYFLCVIYIAHGGFNQNGNVLRNKRLSANGPGAIFPIDGVFKPDLGNWIKIFQGDARGSGFPVGQDGIVSPADPRRKGMKWFTCQVMNLFVHRADARRHMTLADDPSVPNELKVALKRIVFAGFP
ncbi:MAG: hypothetical protein ABI972_29805 [Acidobacteriota bacterium]